MGRPDADIRLDISRFSVNPEAPEALKAALAELTAPFVGKDRAFSDLADAAAEVTRYLQAELGFYLGYAYIPEQVPQDGVIRIEVLEGRLDRVVLEWRDDIPVDRAVVDGYLARLQPGEVLTVRDVERVVFLVNDLRGMSAEFEVRAGDSPGTAIFVVRPRPQPQTTWRADIDNANPRTLGRTRAMGNVTRFSPFGRGDSLSASLVVSKGLAFALGSYASPVGSDGLRLGALVSAQAYQVDEQEFPADIRGTAQTFSAFGLYPVVRSRNLNLFATGSLDAKNYTDRVRSTRTDKRVSNVFLGITGDMRDALGGGGLNSMDAQLMSGRVDYDVPPASDPPDERFTKLVARMTRLQNLIPGRLQALGSLRVQKAWNNLDTTEQFRAGGPDGVRAFPPEEGSGDNGALFTAELRAVLPQDWYAPVGGQAILAAFYDRAVVQLRNTQLDTTVENRRDFGGPGFALTWVSPAGWDLRASIATPTTGQSADVQEQSDVRFYFQFGKQF